MCSRVLLDMNLVASVVQCCLPLPLLVSVLSSFVLLYLDKLLMTSVHHTSKEVHCVSRLHI